jgi:hypothetical protein
MDTKFNVTCRAIYGTLFKVLMKYMPAIRIKLGYPGSAPGIATTGSISKILLGTNCTKSKFLSK